MDSLNPEIELSDKLDHERHGKLVEIVAPSILQHDIGSEILVARVKSDGKELFLSLLDEVLEKLLNKLSLATLLCSFNCVSVHLVVLGEVD